MMFSPHDGSADSRRIICMRSAISTIIRNLLCLVVTYVLPIPARLGVCECFVEDVSSPFAGWFAALDKTAAAEITVVLACVEQRNLPASKAFGREHRLDFGLGLPGPFRPRQLCADHSVGRWDEESVEARHQGRAGPMGGRRTAKTISEVNHGSDS